MQVIDGPLRMSGGSEDRPLVVFQHLQPGTDIGCVIVAVFELEFKIGAQKRCAKLSDKLFLGIPDIAIALLLEGAIKPGGVPRPVHAFMRERRVIALRVAERFELGIWMESIDGE